MTPFRPPPIREQLLALVLALIGAIGFLGDAVRTDRALLPYPPELLQPARQEALAAGQDELTQLYRGNLSLGDKYNQSLAWDRITQDRLRAGELPLWTRDIASGVPFVPQMGQVYHPFNLLLLVLPAAGIYGVWYLLHMVLMGFFAYRFMRRIEIGHAAALLGMVALVAGFWLQARVHHNVMLTAVLPLFPMLSCTHQLLVHRGRGGHMALLALATGLSWICGFAPASLMCTYLVSAFAVVLLLTDGRGQGLAPLLRFAVAMAVGLLLSAAQLGPVLLAAAETSRLPATDSILAERSLEWNHLLTAVWPTLYNWPADQFYPACKTLTHNTWASLALLDKELAQAAFNFPETAFAMGVIPLVLVLSGLRQRLGWFFGAAGLFGLAMALGLLLPWSGLLPGAHSGDLKRFLLLFGLCMPVVAAMGLHRVLQHGRGRLPLLLFALLGLLSLELALLHLYPAGALQRVYGYLAEQRVKLAPGTFTAWIDGYPGEGDANRWHLLQSFTTTAICCLLACLALLRIGRHTTPLLVLATLVELLYLGQGSIVAIPTPDLTTPPPILQPILDSARPNGVRPRLQRLMPADDQDFLNTPVPPNMAGYWGVEDLAGYNPLPKSRMEEFFLALEPHRPGKVPVVLGGAGVNSLRDPASLRHGLCDLIGVEWILTPLQVQQDGLVDTTPAGLAKGIRLYRRSTCLPRATFVRRIEVLPDPEARLARLGEPARDPRQTVLLEQADAPRPSDPAPTQAATVTITSHRDESVHISVDTLADGYLRLADPYDAGWTVTVDGAPSRLYCADHYLRAVYLPAGKHQLVFRFNGTTVWAPQAISLAALLGVVGMLWFQRRRPTVSRR